jgi:hypothetical protein
LALLCGEIVVAEHLAGGTSAQMFGEEEKNLAEMAGNI